MLGKEGELQPHVAIVGDIEMHKVVQTGDLI